ncbi:MAG: hypothetical protein AAF798_07715 [Bacteroidota bacterium]
MKNLNELLEQKDLTLLDEEQLLQVKGGGDPPIYIDDGDEDW